MALWARKSPVMPTVVASSNVRISIGLLDCSQNDLVMKAAVSGDFGPRKDVAPAVQLGKLLACRFDERRKQVRAGAVGFITRWCDSNDRDALVAESGDEFEVAAKCVDVATKGGELAIVEVGAVRVAGLALMIRRVRRGRRTGRGRGWRSP